MKDLNKMEKVKLLHEIMTALLKLTFFLSSLLSSQAIRLTRKKRSEALNVGQRSSKSPELLSEMPRFCCLPKFLFRYTIEI